MYGNRGGHPKRRRGGGSVVNREGFTRSTGERTVRLPHGALKLRLGRDKIEIVDIERFLSQEEAMAKKPKLDLNEGEEVQVKSTHAQPVSGRSDFGDYHMYGVAKADVTECVFFAPDEIHQIISDRKLPRGSEFVLRKVKGKLSMALTGNGQEPKEENSGDGYRELMELSLRDAIEATRALNSVQWDVDSIRSIA
jgi:hypothetical protein